MPYVVGYKGQSIWVKAKECQYCDNYDDGYCGVCGEEVKPENEACVWFAPRGQGGGQ